MSMTPDDLDALLDVAAPPTKTVSICLRGDLRERWDDLNVQVGQAIVATRTSLADDGGAEALVGELQAIEAQMAAATVHLRFVALTDTAAVDLTQQYPPRPGDALDARCGYDRPAYNRALIRACLVEPVFTDEQWDRFLSKLTPHQFNESFEAVDTLCYRAVDVPFAYSESSKPPPSPGSSAPPKRKASRGAAGADGSPPSGPSTTTDPTAESS